MIAKEYIEYINAYFKDNFKKDVFFINKESAKPTDTHFGDRRLYRIEIWAINEFKEKSLVFVEESYVKYEDGKLNKTEEKELLKGLWILTLNNIERINKYGI